MLTPAEELLAAVKEHATEDVSFRFETDYLRLVVVGRLSPLIVVQPCADGRWLESVSISSLDFSHASASSAVYSAFLRARGKQL